MYPRKNKRLSTLRCKASRGSCNICLGNESMCLLWPKRTCLPYWTEATGPQEIPWIQLKMVRRHAEMRVSSCCNLQFCMLLDCFDSVLGNLGTLNSWVRVDTLHMVCCRKDALLMVAVVLSATHSPTHTITYHTHAHTHAHAHHTHITHSNTADCHRRAGNIELERREMSRLSPSCQDHGVTWGCDHQTA